MPTTCRSDPALRQCDARFRRRRRACGDRLANLKMRIAEFYRERRPKSLVNSPCQLTDKGLENGFDIRLTFACRGLRHQTCLGRSSRSAEVIAWKSRVFGRSS